MIMRCISLSISKLFQAFRTCIELLSHQIKTFIEQIPSMAW